MSVLDGYFFGPGLRLLALVAAGLWSPAAIAGLLKGPVLGEVDRTGATVAWQTEGVAAGRVEWGPTESLGQQVEALAGTWHEVRLSGLTTDTRYHYRVVSDGATSPTYSFKTAPGPRVPFRFVAMGDSRSGYNEHRRVVQAVQAAESDVYLNSGDLVCTGEDQVCWQEHFDLERDLMATRPFLPTLGNHDTDGLNCDNYKNYLVLPRHFETEPSFNESFYFFDWGNTRFISLDDQINSQAIGGFQYEWLVQTLDDARRDPEILHIFVSTHVGPYTAKPGREGNHNVRALVELLKSYDVTAVISGHDHHYYSGQAANGLPFIVTGGGGASLYECEPRTDFGVVSRVCEMDYNYVVFDIDGRRVRGTAYTVDGGVLEEWEWESPKEPPADEGGDNAAAAGDTADDGSTPGSGADAVAPSGGGAGGYDAKYGFAGCGPSSRPDATATTAGLLGLLVAAVLSARARCRGRREEP